MPIIKVIIPAHNEAKSIEAVIRDIPVWVDEIVVVNNCSADATAENAENAGATVLKESKKGYGHACLKGMEYLLNQSFGKQKTSPDIVVFLDGDYSDYPQELENLVAPITNENFDFIIGARVNKWREKGAMTTPQIFGNWLACFLMKIMFNANYTDLGPFRAIKFQKLLALQMEDKTYGWTVEMQLKVLKKGYSYKEIPVHYRNRIGESKVSGTLKGTFMAGVKILYWIIKFSFK